MISQLRFSDTSIGKSQSSSFDKQLDQSGLDLQGSTSLTGQQGDGDYHQRHLPMDNVHPTSDAQQHVSSQQSQQQQQPQPECKLSRSGSQLRRQYSVAADPDGNKGDGRRHGNERTSGPPTSERTEPSGSHGDTYNRHPNTPSQSSRSQSRPHSRGPSDDCGPLTDRGGQPNHRDPSSERGRNFHGRDEMGRDDKQRPRYLKEDSAED